jgi:O-antigen ligase
VAQFATHGALTAPFQERPFIGAALNHAEDGLAFLILPLATALMLRRQWGLAAVLVLVTAAVVCILVGETARTAFLLGLAAALVLYGWRRALTRAAAMLSVVLIVTAPLLFPALVRIDAVADAARHMKDSLWHRLQIWSFVGDRIAEKPLLGWGLDSSRAIPGGNQPIPGGYPGQVMLPLHPHNAPLQVWLELGVPGALLLAAFTTTAWLALGKAPWPRPYAAAAGGSLAAALVVALASYGIWQEWLISSEFLTLFLILVMARVARPVPETR